MFEQLQYNSQEIIQVQFESPIFHNALGQYMAFFDGEECLGSGKIFCDDILERYS